MIHELKIDERWYYHVRDLTKNVEIRVHDRDYQAGDTLLMTVPGKGWLRVERRITHVLPAGNADGLGHGYVALSLDDGGKLADAEERARRAEKSNAPLRGTITRLTRELRALQGEDQ
ncbi:RNA binding protein [Gordonia phage Herod]|uniref:RNA binding protein n=1 Tax=Gordonia phage Herod TaxID=2776861 RepID=A0A7M1CST3_9CAUD|nr:RNA binding protein [Gordonia phage Herod]QOP67364.1 RNA binding protein [Gordonia phage Herod]